MRLEVDRKKLRSLRLSIIILDVFDVFLLLFQIMTHELSYISHIIIVIANVFIFLLKPIDEKDSK